MCEIMISFMLGYETKMATLQLLRAYGGCGAYRFLIKTSEHFQCGIHRARLCDTQLTIAYNPFHLTK